MPIAPTDSPTSRIRRAGSRALTNPRGPQLLVMAGRLGAAALLLTFALAATAGKPANVTEAELALLPEYCPDAQFVGRYGDAYTNTSPNAQKWVTLMGRGFWAVHHYCWALINLNRIQKPSVPLNVRAATRESAIGDMNYVVENTPPNFVLLPEIYTKMGEVLLQLRQPVEAGNAFAKARTAKPDYWPPYLHWAEYLRSIGRKADARKVAEEGLSYAPDARPLQALFKSLGGNPAAVAPRTPAPATADSAEKAEAPK